MPATKPPDNAMTNTSAASPLASGYLLTVSTFGWPLVIAGVLKAVYDLLLLAMFAKVTPPEEAT